MVTVVRPFIDRYGYTGVLNVFLLIYLGSFLAISFIFYFLYFRPMMDPLPVKTRIKETNRYALKFSLAILFIYLVWSGRFWPIIEDVAIFARYIFDQLSRLFTL